MKWSKQNKRLIREVIEKHKDILKSKKFERFFNGYFCPFCEFYPYTPEHKCGNCPNEILSKKLDLYCQSCPCKDTAKWQGLLLRIDGFYGTEINVRKRIEFWEDALTLSFIKFKEKWEKKGGEKI